jgi:hypothetical protein
MAKGHRVGGKHHRYTGSSHSEVKGYDAKFHNFGSGELQSSTANKIDPGKHHQAGYMPGLGGGHGLSHMGKGERRGLEHLPRAMKGRGGY